MNSMSPEPMKSSDVIRQACRESRAQAEKADGWKNTSVVLHDSFESIGNDLRATADERECARLALQFEKDIGDPEKKSKAMYEALDMLITPSPSPIIMVLNSMINQMAAAADGWKNTSAILSKGIAYLGEHPQMSENGRTIAGVTLDTLSSIRNKEHCGTILYAALDSIKTAIPGPVGPAVASSMYPVAQKADGWDDTDEVLQSALKSIRDHQQTSDTEKAVAGMALDSVAKIGSSQHRGVVLYEALETLKSGTAGSPGQIMARILDKMAIVADGWDDTVKVQTSGLNTIINSPLTTDREKVTARFALEVGDSLGSSEARGRAVYDFIRLFDTGSSKPTGLSLAETLNDTAVGADGWKSTCRVLESGLQALSENTDLYDAERTAVKEALGKMKSGSWEERSQCGYEALNKIKIFHATMESNRESATQQISEMAENVSKASDPHAVEVEEESVLIGDVRLGIRKGSNESP
ncbi:MAG: hypothetical protein AB9903_09675 [Vulcanimicrobiota bacterium]